MEKMGRIMGFFCFFSIKSCTYFLVQRIKKLALFGHVDEHTDNNTLVKMKKKERLKQRNTGVFIMSLTQRISDMHHTNRMS